MPPGQNNLEPFLLCYMDNPWQVITMYLQGMVFHMAVPPLPTHTHIHTHTHTYIDTHAHTHTHIHTSLFFVPQLREMNSNDAWEVKTCSQREYSLT